MEPLEVWTARQLSKRLNNDATGSDLVQVVLSLTPDERLAFRCDILGTHSGATFARELDIRIGADEMRAVAYKKGFQVDSGPASAPAAAPHEPERAVCAATSTKPTGAVDTGVLHGTQRKGNAPKFVPFDSTC